MKQTIRILICSVLLTVLLTCTASAGPAYPGPSKVSDGLGGTVTVYQHGDEYFSYITTEDGSLLERSCEGVLCYITQDENEAFQLGVPVAQSTSDTLSSAEKDSLQSRILISSGIENWSVKMTALRNEIALQGAALLGDEPQAENIGRVTGNINTDPKDPLTGKVILEEDEPIDSILDAPIPAGSLKDCPLLVLKVNFDDIKCVFSDEEWSTRFFGNGTKSVYDYYKAMSNGKFTFTPATETAGTENDGIISVTIPIDRPDFVFASDDNQNPGKGLRTGVYTGSDGKIYTIYNNSSIFSYALLLADEYIDYSALDTNGDGYIAPAEASFVMMVAGREASSYSEANNDPSYWAQSSICHNEYKGLDPIQYLVPELDGVKLFKFTAGGELLGNTYDYNESYEENVANGNAPIQVTIGQACHELAHNLGLPDLYDMYYSNLPREVSMLSLMAQGIWGCDSCDPNAIPGDSPTALDPYCRIMLGFYEASEITESGSYTLTASASQKNSADYNILRINTEDPDIYYLLENRYFSDYDIGLNYGNTGDFFPGGILIWRIDEKAIRESPRDFNSIDGQYGIMPVANGSVKALNIYGEPADIFLPFWCHNIFKSWLFDYAISADNPFSLSQIEISSWSEASPVMTATVSVGAASTACGITEFSISGLPAVLNDAERTVTLTLPYGSVLTDLKPEFALSNGATATIEDISQTSGETVVDFSSPVTYTITAADSTTKQDWTVTVISSPYKPSEQVIDFGAKRIGYSAVEPVVITITDTRATEDTPANFNIMASATLNFPGEITGKSESELTIRFWPDDSLEKGIYEEYSIITMANGDQAIVPLKFTVLPSRTGGGSSSSSSYTVTFDSSGGSTVASKSVSKNATISEPSAPTRDGYSFSGWYSDAKLTQAFDFKTKITANMTLYARWLPAPQYDADFITNVSITPKRLAAIMLHYAVFNSVMPLPANLITGSLTIF